MIRPYTKTDMGIFQGEDEERCHKIGMILKKHDFDIITLLSNLTLKSRAWLVGKQSYNRQLFRVSILLLLQPIFFDWTARYSLLRKLLQMFFCWAGRKPLAGGQQSMNWASAWFSEWMEKKEEAWRLWVDGRHYNSILLTPIIEIKTSKCKETT